MIGEVLNIGIETISSAISKNIVSVNQYCRDLITEKKAERLGKATGFKALSIAEDGMSVSDMCLSASENIFCKTNIRKEDIGAIIFVSQTPDYILPSTSHILQYKLGLSNDVVAMDICLGCSGYVYGLYVAASMLSNINKKILLCCGDIGSHNTCPTDTATRPITGDAGTATIISRNNNNKVSFAINSYGEKYKTIICPRGGDKSYRLSDEDGNLTASKENYTNMNSEEVLAFTMTEVPKNIMSLINYNCIDINDINLFAFHQANKLIVDTLADLLKVEHSKVPFVASEIGNTSSASIPLIFTEMSNALEKKNLDKILLSGFGVGMSVASALTDLSETNFLETMKI